MGCSVFEGETDVWDAKPELKKGVESKHRADDGLNLLADDQQQLIHLSMAEQSRMGLSAGSGLPLAGPAIAADSEVGDDLDQHADRQHPSLSFLRPLPIAPTAGAEGSLKNEDTVMPTFFKERAVLLCRLKEDLLEESAVVEFMNSIKKQVKTLQPGKAKRSRNSTDIALPKVFQCLTPAAQRQGHSTLGRPPW